MSEPLLEQPIIRVPDFGKGEWLNSAEPLHTRQLRGQVVLVDFWDYTCVNCIRTLPYLKRWYERYHRKGLVVVGVHAPEFRFGQLRGAVMDAIDTFSIPYPVLLDNDYQTWDRFANKAWPTKHLVDGKGYLRLRRQGEGYYQEVEQAIQLLLCQLEPSVSLPDLLPPLRAEDRPGAVCYRPTPELYAGYRGGGLFGGGLGNKEGYTTEGTVHYALPEPAGRQPDRFYLEGFWRAGPEAMTFAGQRGGRVLLPYRAASVNAVLSPSADPVELMLEIRPAQTEPLVEVLQDGRPLERLIAGEDIYFDQQGRSLLHVDRPRMYSLVRNPGFEVHRLDLIFQAHGLALYSLSFGGCVAEEGGEGSRTYRVH